MGAHQHQSARCADSGFAPHLHRRPAGLPLPGPCDRPPTGGAVCREVVGQDVPVTSAHVGRVYVEHAAGASGGGCHAALRGHRPHCPHAAGRYAGVESAQGTMDHTAHGNGSYGCDQCTCQQGSHWIRGGQDEPTACGYPFRCLPGRNSAAHSCRGPHYLQDSSRGQLRNRRTQLD